MPLTLLPEPDTSSNEVGLVVPIPTLPVVGKVLVCENANCSMEINNRAANDSFFIIIEFYGCYKIILRIQDLLSPMNDNVQNEQAVY